MLQFLRTVVPTNATSGFTQTASTSGNTAGADFVNSISNTYFESTTGRGVTACKDRSTTGSGSAQEITNRTTNIEGNVDVFNTTLNFSGAFTESWNGAFTYTAGGDGDTYNRVGNPITEVLDIGTTSETTTTFEGSVSSTRTSSTLTASLDTSGGVFVTTSTATTIPTTSFGSVSTSTMVTAESNVTETTAYQLTIEDLNPTYREWSPEYATILVPEKNEVLWLITASADGVLSAVAQSHTGEVTIYPSKEFYDMLVTSAGYSAALTAPSTTTSFFRSNGILNTTVRVHDGFLPAAENSNRTRRAIQPSSFTNSAILQTAGYGSAASRNTVAWRTFAMEAAGTNWTQIVATTTQSSQFHNTFIGTSSDAGGTSDAGEDEFGSGSETNAYAEGNSAEGQWSRELPRHYIVTPPTVSHAARTFIGGWFALNSGESYASKLQAGNFTVQIPSTVLGNQIIQAPYPTTWTYTSGASSVTARAWAAGISRSSISEGSDATVSTTEGTWVTEGTPATNLSENQSRAWGAGVQPSGAASVLAAAGSYYTFNESNSGLAFLQGQSTTSALFGAFPTPNCLVGGEARYVTTQRNFTAMPS